MSTRCHIAICKNKNSQENGEFLHMRHHCDGYPSGVGSELSSILSECPLPWTPESVQKFINNYDEDYRITTDGVAWDQEYVYIIFCDELLLCGYYKGITSKDEDFDLKFPGDELLIPDNLFSEEKPKDPYWYQKKIYQDLAKSKDDAQKFLILLYKGTLSNVT